MILPPEIQQMDQTSIQLYKQLLDEGYEVVYNIRVVVVGHKGAGKTTLTKRLFNRDVVIGKEESTNGIEVHVDRCKVLLEKGQWIISESDKKPTNASNRLVKLLKKPETFTGSDLRKMEVNNDTVEEDSFEKADKKDVSDETKKRKLAKDWQDTLDESMQMPTVDSKTADVSIWDFAGQTEFYDTHQVFLSKRAIYLLVTDMSKQVNDIVEDGNKNWKISEFVDFWLTSIYEFCGTKDSDGPPVILVGTFADKLKQVTNQESKEETIGTFFCDLRKCLIDYKATFNLLKKCIPIDNSIKDDKIEELKQHIVEQASKQAYWGEHYPAKWITLERSIGKWKDKGEKILKKDQLFDLNSKLPVPIKQKDGLDLFLRFHHDSGNILYFSEEELSNTIVLDPQWLIDAFKSLITARYFCISQDPAIFQEWIKFEESAILKVTLVEKIWELKESTKFHKHLLLKYLEKLGIIAKPHHLPGTTDVTDYYFAPCFLKQTPPDDLLSPERLPENRRSTSKLCLTTELHFLHAAVFNKLLAACINKWQLSKRDGKYLVYRGCAIFDLEQNHTLYVYFFNHVIQIWLTKCSTKKEKPSQSVCLDVYTFLLDRLTNCLNRSGNVKVLFKCSSSKHNSIENMFPIDELSEKSEVVCKCTTEEHVFETKELTEYWLNSKKFPKDSCIFDGRLIVLDSNQINVLEASLNEKPIGQGGIGTVYRCNNPDIFGIPVAVKKINTKGDSKIESQVRREKIACRLMNPFILPLLAVFEKSNESNK
ncbi:probable serine/threonine-protein kinase roco8 isoform X3 [Ruditapes philippinarum]|uniref:probable serine/threonine-protein kinase roco8 isoform X3 n=1 Tax=Ruditapes philippinarum TaxID=129788 RepID=UPI00295C0B0C|nr:probable serine/threonine-protein kinase roco8 isoform X3 [Ruditapes philippinarum]